MKLRALEVSELSSYIKRILINDPILYNIRIKGEISNFKVHSSQNVYLTLKDEKSRLNCVIFKKNYDKKLNLKNGTKVIADGYISLYERDGSYQLYINSIEKEGLGELHLRFEELKEKLSKEGLFDSKYKKQIPKVPRNIGVVTSPTGAVIRDIINVVKRRYPKVSIKLYPVNVQGERSTNEICEGIDFFNSKQNVDVIIIGRGGGSLEELWSFNEESVARKIFSSNIPIISAVGHETDYTISDFVSDMRASTPSVAAEIATPSLKEIEYKIENCKKKMEQILINKIDIEKYKIEHVMNRINNHIELYVIKDNIIQVDKIYDKINFEMKNKLSLREERLISLASQLHNLSPLATLNRGYGVIQKEDKVISSIDTVEINDRLDITLSDGNIYCVVEHIKSKEV